MINLKKSTIIAGLIILTYQQNLLKHHLHTETRSGFQDLRERVEEDCQEKTSPAEICAVHGTAVLVGDEELPDLVAVCDYDQKPVHFLSMICESIKWIECHKEGYCVETEQVETIKFLHLNINSSYNHDMGGVDIADQLHNYYRFDHWSRQ